MGIERAHLDRSRPPQEVLSLSQRESEDFRRDSFVTLCGLENPDKYYYEGMTVLLDSEPDQKLDDVKFSGLPKA